MAEAPHEQEARHSLDEGDAALYAVVVQHILYCILVWAESHALLRKRYCRQEDSLQVHQKLSITMLAQSTTCIADVLLRNSYVDMHNHVHMVC